MKPKEYFFLPLLSVSPSIDESYYDSMRDYSRKQGWLEFEMIWSGHPLNNLKGPYSNFKGMENIDIAISNAIRDDP